MSTAELNKKKLDLIAWINKLSDENIIEFLDCLKKSKSKVDWWDDLSENQQKMLQHGIDDIDTGNVISSTQFWNELKNGWERGFYCSIFEAIFRKRQQILFPDSLDQFVDQENEVRIIDLFVGASADVGRIFIAYNLRRILNILDQDIVKNFFQELAFFSLQIVAFVKAFLFPRTHAKFSTNCTINLY